MLDHNTCRLIVIVRGGVTGLELATDFGTRYKDDPDIRVVLVDRDFAHVWKPMLHTVTAGTQDLTQQQTAYLAQAHDNRFVYQVGAMCGLDRPSHQIKVTPVKSPDRPSRQKRNGSPTMSSFWQ